EGDDMKGPFETLHLQLRDPGHPENALLGHGLPQAKRHYPAERNPVWRRSVAVMQQKAGGRPPDLPLNLRPGRAERGGPPQRTRVPGSEGPLAVNAIDVSIIIPTFRRPALLRAAIASLLAQQKLDASVEIVVIDNDPAGSAAEVVTELTPGSPLEL